MSGTALSRWSRDWIGLALLALVANACAIRVPQAASRSEAFRPSGQVAKRRNSTGVRLPQVTLQPAAQRTALDLPFVAAKAGNTPVSVLPFASKQEFPASINAIVGEREQVWLLGDTSLYESDGKEIRLAKGAICVTNPEANLAPIFDTLRLDGGELEVLGRVGGGCGFAAMKATRQGNRAWRCEQGHAESFGIRRWWSAGELITVTNNFDESLAFDSAPFKGELASILTPIAVARGRAHAWALVVAEKDSGARLAEWTGMRWRDRDDAIPAGVQANDIVAMTIDDEGQYYLATRNCLLLSEGERFVARPIPRGFEPELMIATRALGLWGFGGKRAWHYEAEIWSSVELPMEHVRSLWLNSKGLLWVGGSSPISSRLASRKDGPDNAAVVVTLPLSGKNRGAL